MDANPHMLDLYVYYVNERDAVQVRRRMGVEPPWSEDPILQNYHFCNNRREDDRGTIEIRAVCHELGVPEIDLPEFYTAARMFNKASTVDDYWRYGPKTVKSIRECGTTIFHTAYVVSTCGVSMDKIDYVDRVVKEVGDYLCPRTSCRAAFDYLRGVSGLGSFLAGQIVADLKNDRYLADAPDWHTFAVMGPGSKKGLDHIYGPGTTERNFTKRLDRLRADTAGLIPELHAQDLQNTLCEFSKMVRYTYNMRGRRRPYHAHT